MSEITPTTDQLRMAWITQRWNQAGQLRSEGSDDEFDRWLARVKEEAAATALEEFATRVDSYDWSNYFVMTPGLLARVHAKELRVVSDAG